MFGADIFREWDEPHAGSANALLLVADTCLELFGVSDPDGVVGRWASRHGQGWHSLEWTLPSFEQAVEVTSALGIALTERVEGAYVFTHPRDCHGICLELTAAHFANDARDVAGWEPTYWRDEHPLGIDGSPCIRVSSHDALDAARWLASLTGREVDYDEHRPQLVGRAVGVHLAGHSIEFVEPEGEGALSRFLEARGERIHSVSFPVRDLSARARAPRGHGGRGAPGPRRVALHRPRRHLWRFGRAPPDLIGSLGSVPCSAGLPGRLPRGATFRASGRRDRERAPHLTKGVD